MPASPRIQSSPPACSHFTTASLPPLARSRPNNSPSHTRTERNNAFFWRINPHTSKTNALAACSLARSLALAGTSISRQARGIGLGGRLARQAGRTLTTQL